MRATVTPASVLMIGTETFRVALGRGRIRTDKREGDGATPAGSLPLRAVLYRPDRVLAPQSAAPTTPLSTYDGWCDDPGHADYNRPVRLPISASAEKVHLDVQFSRYRADGSVLGRYRSIWVVSFIDRRWAAQLRSSFAP